jgi:hypothetical protein
MVYSNQRLHTPGMYRVIEADARRLNIRLERDGEFAGGFFVYSSDAHLVAYACEQAFADCNGTAGSIPLVGRRIEIRYEPSAVIFQTIADDGERKKPTIIEGEELDALDRAVADLLRGAA